MKSFYVWAAAGLLLSAQAPAQVVGGRGSGMSSPAEVKASALSGGSSTGDVNLFSGTYGESYTFGTVKTPSGLSYTLSLSYSSTFMAGDNVPIASGIPYGEGWSPNIPMISVTTEAYQKYEASTSSTVTRSFTGDERIEEGRLWWFAPMISIPGVISERFVFKHKDGDNLVFIPSSFDRYVEARFNGQVWEVNLNDGTRYRFETAMLNTRSPSNQRVIEYNNNNATNPEYLGKEALANLIFQKGEVMSWYCDQISHPNHTYGQRILFSYEKFGQFDYYQEFSRQTDMRQAIVDRTVDVRTYCVPWVEQCGQRQGAAPSFFIYRDVFLKEVAACDNANYIEKLELKYSTAVGSGKAISPGQVHNMLLPGDPGVSRLDSLYNYKTVYTRGGSGGWAGWNRFYHQFSDYSKNHHNGLYPADINPLNPYKAPFNGDVFYSAAPIAPSLAQVPFDHSYLESERITSSEALVPGDLYEVKATILGLSGVTSPAVNFDINIASGSDMAQVTLGTPLGGKDYRATNYETSRGTSLFSTFNQAVKWNQNGASTLTSSYSVLGDVVTSNFFSMPNTPREFNGYHIQIGPANSDNRFNETESSVYNGTTPRAEKTYFVQIPRLVTNPELKATARMPYSFGVGLPWHMMRPVWGVLSGNTPYQFWFNRYPGSVFGNLNQPTMATASVKLKGMELIRYSKNPYMLTQVNYYVYNGLQNEQNTGAKLVRRHELVHTNRILDTLVNNRTYLLNEQPEFRPDGQHNVFLLKSVRQVPVNPSTGAALSYNAAKELTTHYSYTPLRSFVKAPLTVATATMLALTQVTDQLGKVTLIAYNDTFRVSSRVNNSIFARRDFNPPPGGVNMGSQVALQVQVRVKSKTVLSETSPGLPKTWEYTFSSPTSHTELPVNLGSHFDLTRFDVQMGFRQARVTEPAPLAGQQRPFSLWFHHGHEKPDLFGKLDHSVSYRGDGAPVSRKDIAYRITMAYKNGIYTGIVKPPRLDGEWPLLFRDDETESSRTLAGIEAGFEDVRFLESLHPELFPDKYQHSYFVRKVKETDTQYEPAPLLSPGGSGGPRISSPVLSVDPTLTGTILQPGPVYTKIENITEYEYYYTDSMGGYTSPGIREVMHVGAEPESRVYFEPSWELYSRTSYSPQLPGVFSKEEYFYYYDLQNVPQDNGDYLGYGGLFRFRELNKLVQFNMRNTAYQHRITTQSQGQAPVTRSTFYIYDAYWNATDDVSSLDTIIQNSPLVASIPCTGLCSATPGSGSGTSGGSGSSGTGNALPEEDCRPVARPDLTVPPPGYVLREYNGAYYFCPCRLGCTTTVATSSSSVINAPEAPDQPDPTDPGDGSNPPGFMILDYPLYNKVLLRTVARQIDTVMADLYFAANRGSKSLLRFREQPPDPSNPNIVKFRPMLPFDTLLVSQVEERNHFGQERIVKDARGLRTRYYFTRPSRFWHRHPDPCFWCNNFITTHYEHMGLPVAVTVGFGQPDSLRTEYLYNRDNSVKKVTDPNGKTVEYAYDGHGRLSTLHRNGSLIGLNRYRHWDNDFGKSFAQRSAQNYVESYVFHNPSLQGLRTRSFSDPLGRAVSTGFEAIDDSLEASNAAEIHYSPYNEYDNRGLPTRTYNAFTYANAGMQSIQPQSGPSGNPFRAFTYEPDQRSRALRAAPQGEDIASGHVTQYAYAIIDGGALATELSLSTASRSALMPCSNCTYSYYRTTETDPDGKPTLTYSDALGRKVAMRQETTPGVYAVTLFLYDSYGNLGSVINPEGQVTRYDYNMAGWLYRKQSVDAGTVHYVYDGAGALVIEEDAKLRAEGLLRTHSYDRFGRKIRQGRSGRGSLTLGDEHYSYSRRANPFFVYHQQPEKEWFYGPFINAADPTYAVKARSYLSTDRTYMKGRLSHTLTYSEDGSKPLMYCFYSYNRESQVKWEIQQFNPNGFATEGWVVRMDYPAYDLQDRLLTQNIDVNSDQVLDFQNHYVYDGFGMLKEVYANFNDSRSGGFRVASYEYDHAKGLVKEIRYHSSIPGFDDYVTDVTLKQYDIRDRLTSSLSNTFEWRMYYDGASPGTGAAAGSHYNGNINGTLGTYRLAQVSNASIVTNFASPTLYGYQYDRMNRLSLADAQLLPTGSFFASAAYGDESYSYDRIGNIATLIRNGSETFAYSYRTRTSQLMSVQTGNPTIAGPGTYQYTYDANGSVIADTHRGVSALRNGRANLPFGFTVTSAGVARNVSYQYNADDGRVFKIQTNPANGGVTLADFYLRDYTGREAGILNLVGRQWTWYVQGRERVARVTPTAAQQPAFGSAISEYSQLDTSSTANRGRIRALVNAQQLPDRLLEIRRSVSNTSEFIMQKTLETLQSNNTTYLVYQTLSELGIGSLDDILTLPGTGGVIKNTVVTNVRKVKGLFDPGDVLPSDPVNRDPYQFHPDTVTHDMVYYIYDHLGNTRVSYTPNINPANVAVSYEVRNMLDYYPSGKLLRTYSQGEGERYLVTGKERDTETGYDCFGARAFESEIVRWLSVDPLTDKYPSWSSYAYVGGNSVLNIDFDGRDWGDVINGAARGVFDNLTGANTRANYRPNSASEYNEALYKADLVSVAFGTMMIVNGGMNISGGVALAPATEGASLAVSIAGTAEVSLGTMLLMNGSKNLGNSESEKKIEKSYKRPNNATTPEQRKSVQGKPCIDCGTGGKMNADHKQPLVKEYYETGKIDKAKMKEVESVQPQCPTCSSRQGAELKKYSQEQKKANGLE